MRKKMRNSNNGILYFILLLISSIMLLIILDFLNGKPMIEKIMTVVDEALTSSHEIYLPSTALLVTPNHVVETNYQANFVIDDIEQKDSTIILCGTTDFN